MFVVYLSWSNWNLEMLGFEKRGKPEYPGRTSDGAKKKTNNKLNPHGVDAGIWTLATSVGGEFSHHCAIPWSFVSSGHCSFWDQFEGESRAVLCLIERLGLLLLGLFWRCCHFSHWPLRSCAIKTFPLCTSTQHRPSLKRNLKMANLALPFDLESTRSSCGILPQASFKPFHRVNSFLTRYSNL